eukprot:m.32029 g.32029  ORF g.32029 m.32029 type:complete len:78 (+) comp5444_c0_seq2:301-534(+)
MESLATSQATGRVCKTKDGEMRMLKVKMEDLVSKMYHAQCLAARQIPVAVRDPSGVPFHEKTSPGQQNSQCKLAVSS